MIECLLINLMNPTKIEKSIHNLIKVSNEINEDTNENVQTKTILQDLYM